MATPATNEQKGLQDRLRMLSARVLTIQEEERRHISRDLHDDIGQSMTALKFALHRLVPLVNTEGAAGISDCIGMAEATLERVRQIAHDMHPPQLDQLGLEAALRGLVESQREATGLDIKCHFNGMLRRRFDDAMEIACYRITQEALSNASRHAQASSVLVAIEASVEALTLMIRDDGKGFDSRAMARRTARSSSLGLISMDERAKLAGGRLTVTSQPGQGTIVRATFAARSKAAK